MIDLAQRSEPYEIALPYGLRVTVRPLTTAGMAAAQAAARGAVEAIERQARERTEAGLPPDGLPDLSAEGERDGFYQARLIRELAVRHIISWTGVEREGGSAPPTPENVAAVTITSSVSVTNDTAWHTLVATWRKNRLELYVDGISRASSTAANTATSDAFGIYRWGFSSNQDFNGDIALILCCGACWTGHMVRRWHADPFGFLRPWNEVPALMGSAPPATPPSTGTGVITFLMG